VQTGVGAEVEVEGELDEEGDVLGEEPDGLVKDSAEEGGMLGKMLVGVADVGVGLKMSGVTCMAGEKRTVRATPGFPV